MALSEDGQLYAATLGGSVLAMDAIRGTRLWEAKVDGSIYGGVIVAGDALLVPAGSTVAVLNRADGRMLRTLPMEAEWIPRQRFRTAWCMPPGMTGAFVRSIC